MPRYRYQCNECQQIVIVFHGIKENYEDCNKCEQKQTMKKLLSVPFIIKKGIVNDLDRNVGDITNEYIEINREILEQQKEEGKKTDYEPT
jgi:putative FmdB family regulatory protein